MNQSMCVKTLREVHELKKLDRRLKAKMIARKLVYKSNDRGRTTPKIGICGHNPG